MSKPTTSYSQPTKPTTSFAPVAKSTTPFTDVAKQTTSYANPSKNTTDYSQNPGAATGVQLDDAVVTLASAIVPLSGFVSGVPLSILKTTTSYGEV